MDRIFPSAVVAGYEHLMPALTLPDAGDRHVLVAAIAGGANTLVTFNLRHLPVASLVPSGVEPIHPELFLLELLRRDEAVAAAAICWAVKRPARLDAITKLGLKELANYCRRLLGIPSGTLCPPG